MKLLFDSMIVTEGFAYLLSMIKASTMTIENLMAHLGYLRNGR